MTPDDVPVSGAVTLVLLVVDVVDEPDGLVDVDAFGLDDGDVLFVDLGEGLDEVVDTAACEGAGLVQDGLGLGSAVFLAVPPVVGLLLGVPDTVGVVVGVPPGLTLGLGLGLGLGLLLALPESLAAGLVVLPLLALPLDDVARVLAVPVALLCELLLVGVADGCVDSDAQALGEGGRTTGALLADTPPVAEGAWVTPEAAVLALFEGVLMLRAEPMASPTFITAWRAGGTTDRTTPTANTAAPTAKAGRSMASRQSLCRCGSRRRRSG